MFSPLHSSTRASHTRAVFCLVALLALGCSSPEKAPPDRDASIPVDRDASEVGYEDATRADTSVSDTVRVATLNASLFRNRPGELVSSLNDGSEQASDIAEIVQHVQPDILLINEFDRDEEGEAAPLFAEEYLATGPDGIDYPHVHVPQTNTGVSSGVDLDGDGEVATTVGSTAYGNDSFGFGTFPGQYGMVIYSRFPIVDTRTFRELRWADMPDSLMPTDWFSDEAVEVFRLSSKNHVDLGIDIDGRTLHVLASHPTPPGFDGDEDRNGRRNHDEIRFWTDYVSGAPTSDWIVDDSGAPGGIAPTSPFVVVGDLNNDPNDADSRHEAIRSLLDHERTRDPRPSSDGAVEASERDGEVNSTHVGDPALDTADFSDGRVGNIRADYVLPSSDLRVVDAGVHWPVRGDEDRGPIGATDHRLVWVDVEVE